MPDIEALIRERAYLIWEESGKPVGRDRDHWFQAAKEVSAIVPQNGASLPSQAAVAKPATKKAPAKKR